MCRTNRFNHEVKVMTSLDHSHPSLLTRARQAMRLLLAVAIAGGLLVGLAPTASAEEGLHIVRAGEQLAHIAGYYDVDLYDLSVLNGITDPDLIQPGMQLVLPGTRLANPYGARAAVDQLPGEDGYYVVQPGDSLSLIAVSHGMDLADLLRINGLESSNVIWVGQQLRVTTRVEPVQYEAVAEPQPALDIYVVGPGDSLSEIASLHGTTVEELLIANGIPNANFVYAGQRLRIPANLALREAATNIAGAPADGERRIEVDLSDQTLSAWQGDVRIMYTSVSTGKWATPTVTGEYAVGRKYESQDMYGDDYYLPDVPWVMYFYEAFAIHGVYWHANFGTPSSHGCVNMRADEAAFLFDWAAPGTSVVVNE